VSEEVRIPDYMGRMAGVRSWKVAPTLWAKMGGWLWSAANLGPWPDGEENVAVCETGHPTPAKGCSCGLYAFYDPASGLPYSTSARTEAGAVSGVIGVAGRIIPGDLAFRAERAKVLALFDDPHDSSTPLFGPGRGRGARRDASGLVRVGNMPSPASPPHGARLLSKGGPFFPSLLHFLGPSRVKPGRSTRAGCPDPKGLEWDSDPHALRPRPLLSGSSRVIPSGPLARDSRLRKWLRRCSFTVLAVPRFL
jgi:hypothetical protein